MLLSWTRLSFEGVVVQFCVSHDSSVHWNAQVADKVVEAGPEDQVVTWQCMQGYPYIV